MPDPHPMRRRQHALQPTSQRPQRTRAITPRPCQQIRRVLPCGFPRQPVRRATVQDAGTPEAETARR